ncbi:hypothetical protein COO60DRAFT_272858 [Scenedesmus sp. NREL 46B-D3]|nr:hypothetical protein COO60DRAFT_272858 [Scenedesmus sp. NREL 46B-D3]
MSTWQQQQRWWRHHTAPVELGPGRQRQMYESRRRQPIGGYGTCSTHGAFTSTVRKWQHRPSSAAGALLTVRIARCTTLSLLAAACFCCVFPGHLAADQFLLFIPPRRRHTHSLYPTGSPLCAPSATMCAVESPCAEPSKTAAVHPWHHTQPQSRACTPGQRQSGTQRAGPCPLSCQTSGHWSECLQQQQQQQQQGGAYDIAVGTSAAPLIQLTGRRTCRALC